MYSDCNAFAFVHLKLRLINWLIWRWCHMASWSKRLVAEKLSVCHCLFMGSQGIVYKAKRPESWMGQLWMKWIAGNQFKQSSTMCVWGRTQNVRLRTHTDQQLVPLVRPAAERQLDWFLIALRYDMVITMYTGCWAARELKRDWVNQAWKHRELTGKWTQRCHI